MAKMTKREMIKILKSNGYFSQHRYKYDCDIAKEYSWQQIKEYYSEMIENT